MPRYPIWKRPVGSTFAFGNPFSDWAHTALERMKNPDAKVVLWASLECTNHSRAKGGMSRDADSRTLAEHLFRYIEELQPDYIQIENVVEFMEWGPLRVKVVRDPETGAESCPLDIKHDRKRKQTTVAPVWIPDPERKGTLYRKWVEEVCARGYRFDHRVLNSADFGAYTSRVREVYERRRWVVRWREAALVCRFPRANVSRFCSYYDRRLGNDVRLTDDLRRLVAAKAQVAKARRKMEEYVAWNRANNLFFDEATDEELAQFRAKLGRKVAGVEAAEERMRRKIWNLKSDKND